MHAPAGKIWRRRAGSTIGVLLALWALVAAAGWAGYLGWQAELFANFPAAPVLAAAAAAVLLARFSRPAVAILGSVILVAVVAGTLVPRPRLTTGAPTGPTMKFATWNLFIGSAEPRAILRWIEASDPDVIAFTEVTQQLHGLLEKSLRARYPCRLGNPRSGPNGLAIFSKVPLANWERLSGATHYASCDFQWPGGPVCKLIVAHPPAPTSGGWQRARGEVLREIADRVVAEPRPVVVLGDFNATWAVKDFRYLCRTADLLPATDYLPSWSASLPGLLRIPIDHVLARNRDFRSVSAAAGSEGAGSDHLPVLAELALRPPGLVVVP